VAALSAHLSASAGNLRGLAARLEEGTGPGDSAIARELALETTSEDALALAVMVRVDAPRAFEGAAWSPPLPVPSETKSDASFLGQLDTTTSGARIGIDSLDDVPTLIGVLRGGSLRQRRASIRRLGELAPTLVERDRVEADQALSAMREEGLSLELARARAALSSTDLTELRAEELLATEALEALTQQVARYYEQEGEQEPLSLLDAESLARIGTHFRGASEGLVAHVSAILEGALIVPDESRLALISAMRISGDPRLVAVLGVLLDSPSRELALESARALGTIDSHGAHVLLRDAYRARTTPADRAVLAGALALHGDVSARAELRDTMRADDPKARLAAVQAIGSIATSDDFDPLASLLGTGTLGLDRALIRSLGKLGDARALRLLREFRASERGRVLQAEMDDAMQSIRAQMELRGERDAPQVRVAPIIVRSESSRWGRFRCQMHVFVADLWRRAGFPVRALRRLNLAIEMARDVAEPWILKGMILEARQSDAEALGIWRRAIEIDRDVVQRRAIRAVARTFLRRAEATREEGRRDVARGLLDEVLALDLSRAPIALQQAIRRERERLALEDA